MQSQGRVVIFVDRRRQEQTVTITSLSSTQTPLSTSGTGSVANTNGSVITTLETEGISSAQPFPTSLSSISEATLTPAGTTITPQSRPSSASPLSITNTVTLPISTYQTVIVSETIAVVPEPTVITVSSIVVSESTYTVDGVTHLTSTVYPTYSTSTATYLRTTTIPLTATIAQTATTVVSSGTLTSILNPTITTSSLSAPNAPMTSTIASNGTLITIVVPTTTGVPSGTLISILPTPTGTCKFDFGCGSQNLFEPVGIGAPPSNIPSVGNHPVPRTGIIGMNGPIGTNKFYFNFFLGSQSQPAFVMPYSLSWSKGGGNAQSWGMTVSHVDDSQKVYGPNNDRIPGSPASYYINPLGIQSLILSAAELASSTVLTTDSLTDMSANVNLSPKQGSSSHITFPLVQGMASVTAVYSSLQPEIQTGVFYRSVEALGQLKLGVYKYRITLEDGKIWLLYATPSLNVDPNLQLLSSTMLQGIPGWSGSIQVAKLPVGADETVFDDTCGVYPTSGAVGGYASGTTAQYSLSWTKGGMYSQNSTLLMYALPHHVQSFNQDTASKAKQVYLQTPTKGLATAIAADCWILNEQLHPTMGFAPWRPDTNSANSLPSDAIALIQKVAPIEASQDMNAQTDLNSMYFSGKGLSKFATIVYTMNDLANQQALAATALTKLKAAFATFAENRQVYPLYYDSAWKGIVSSASYVTGYPGVDFGNSYYNDHHFHYGYFIHAAAIIGYLDPSWAQANKDYINTLVRDVANPSILDTYFPVFRSFDWYHGHSWAKGLFETGDGKDQESSSEDAMFAYGLKMWGRTIGDASMEQRGDLMLSVLARSIQSYYLMDSDNKNQPARFIGNKDPGILFENKCDHVTYFGTNLEYVQGIQMIPALPFSTLTRTQKFVIEEWQQYFGDGAVDPAQNVQGGWRSILFGNLAIINPQAAYNFFSQDNFDSGWLDGGASLTWYLAYSAGLGGAQ